MKSTIRVRFAPSPTGPLHIGGVKTASVNYAFAKKHKGTFILRIEDTDQKRFVSHSEAYITEALAWLNIYPDEGPTQGGKYGPYRQSERKELYGKYALELIKRGKAYYAFDTPEELEAMRIRFKAQGMVAPQYNAITRMQMKNSLTLSQKEVEQKLATGHPYVVRMLIDPKSIVKTKTELRGWIQFRGEELEDKVLLKADRMPTYHLANIVDDHLMNISHVIRGEEWIPSLPYHILLYQNLDWTPPEFVHLPLLLNANGKGKLSKRSTQQGTTLILPLDWKDPTTQEIIPGFREADYLPEALFNFLMLLGWHPKGNQELFTPKELIANFSISGISKAGARFDMNKANWFNQQHLQNMESTVLAQRYLLPALKKQGIVCPLDYTINLCELLKKGITFPSELTEKSKIFFIAPDPSTAKAQKTWGMLEQAFLIDLSHQLSTLVNFTSVELEKTIKEQIKKHNIKMGEAMQRIRLAITGQKVGAPLMELLATLGKKEVNSRLQNFIRLF